MKSTLTALLLLAALAGPLAGQEAAKQGEWVETRFHRVYLRNGYFIDGQLLKNTEKGATLSVTLGEKRSGEMMIRPDMIDRIEFMKIRSFNEPTRREEVKREKPEIKKETPVKRTATTKMADAGVDQETRNKVDGIIARMKKAGAEEKAEIANELNGLGAQAAVYLATNLDALDEDTITLVGPMLGQSKDPKAQEMLVKMLGSSKANVRAQAGASLGASGDAGVARHLVPLLKDPDTIVKGVAVDGLANLKAVDSAGSIARVCLDSDRALRSRAFNAFTKLMREGGQEGDVVRILSDVLGDSQGSARADLLTNLGKVVKKTDWNLVAPYLADDDVQVRQSAAFLVGNMGAPETADLVAGRLPVESDKWARVYLAGSTLKLRAYRGVETLIAWLDDADADVKSAAHQSLRQLTGKAIEPDRKKWQDMWDLEKGKYFKE